MPSRGAYIDVEGLTVDGRRLLDGITCGIGRGGITVLMGPNGAGKSLFLRCLHGLVRADGGSIAIGDRPLDAGMRLDQSFVFQHPTLLRRTVMDNLRFVARERGIAAGAAGKWLDRVGLSPQAQQPARSLSGGEKQRLALARALMTGPSVLFLDEATSNLDPASVQTIEAIAREAASDGTKVIAVTHDIAQGRRLADDVLFMAGGRVVEEGPSDRFFGRPRSKEAKAYLDGRILV